MMSMIRGVTGKWLLFDIDISPNRNGKMKKRNAAYRRLASIVVLILASASMPLESRSAMPVGEDRADASGMTLDEYDRADCYAGQTVNSGEQCTYPGAASLIFSVSSSGGASFAFFNVSSNTGTISVLNTTLNGISVNFLAMGNGDGSWFLQEVGDDVAVTVGVTVSETALTVTEEDATGDTYTVVLDSAPTANVVVTVGGHSGTDVTAAPATLTFTNLNWETAQTVTVTAGNDADTANDTVSLTHSAAGTDSDYNGISITGVTVTVNDNDTAQVTGVMVAQGNAQLVVNWTAVGNATGYKVQWKSGGQSYNTSTRQATIASGSTTTHTIASLTNDTEYTVRVTATRTGFNDGPPSAEMTGTPAAAATAGVTVSETALTVTEEDATGDAYTVVLDSEPTANVVVTVGGHSGTDVTPTPATLTFTNLNWETAQTVTVTAGNDADTANDSVSLTHSATSTDSDYNGISIAGVTVTVNDNDTVQPAGICGRTAAVRTAILGLTSGVSNCGDVTAAHLADITALYLNSNGITALAAGDFDGLTALEQLRLYNNSLSTLPAGVFDELTALTELNLRNNSLSTLPAGVFDELTALTELNLRNNSLSTLPAGVFDELTALTTLRLQNNSLSTLPAGVFDELTALTTLQLQANLGAPFSPTADALPDDGTVLPAGGTVTLDGSGSDGGPWGTNVTYSWAASGATVTFDDAASATPVVTIPALADGTELTFTLTVTGRATDTSRGTAPDTDTATVTVTAFDPTAGICGRTEAVRDAIVGRISGVTNCADVTDAHLAAITGTLYLDRKGITALAAGDFDGLTALTILLDLANSLSTLPAGVFDELTALKYLWLTTTLCPRFPPGCSTTIPR